MATMGPSWKVLEEECKVVMGFNMVHVRIAQLKYATQWSCYIQHYAPLGVGQKLEDCSVQLGVHITNE